MDSDQYGLRMECKLYHLETLHLCSFFRHNFLRVYYGSEVKGEVDFIEGDSAMRSFSAGYYIENGMSVTETDVTTQTLSVRPKKPFLVSTEFWSKLTLKGTYHVLSIFIAHNSTK